MNKARLMLRTGLCIAIIGLAVFLANVVAQGAGDITQQLILSPGPNGADAALLIPLNYGGHEIRVNAPRTFSGVLYVFDYDGINELAADGTITPMVNETFKGSTLIDFTLNRRGPYVVMIESNVSTEAQITASVLEKGTLRQDYLWDSGIIIAVGVATTVLAFTIKKVSKKTPSNRPKIMQQAHNFHPQTTIIIIGLATMIAALFNIKLSRATARAGGLAQSPTAPSTLHRSIPSSLKHVSKVYNAERPCSAKILIRSPRVMVRTESNSADVKLASINELIVLPQILQCFRRP